MDVVYTPTHECHMSQSQGKTFTFVPSNPNVPPAFQHLKDSGSNVLTVRAVSQISDFALNKQPRGLAATSLELFEATPQLSDLGCLRAPLSYSLLKLP